MLVESAFWQSRLSESAEAKLQTFGSPGRDEMRKPNFTSLEVLAEQVRKRNLRSFEVLAERSAESGSLPVKAERNAEAELQIFGSQGRAELRKRIIRS